MSKIESAVRIVLEFKEAFNRHDLLGMMQLVIDDCIFENAVHAPDGIVYSGKHEIKKFWETFFRESLHAHIEVEEIFGSGERCVMRWRYEWEGSEKEIKHIRGVDVFRVRNGTILEMFSYTKR